MKYRIYFPLALFVLGVLSYYSMESVLKDPRETKTGMLKDSGVKNSEGAHNLPSSEGANVTARFPAALSFTSLLSPHIRPEVLEQVEVQVIDSGEGFMRLALFKNQIVVENSDFHFAQNEQGDWKLKDGEWIFGEVQFPRASESLSELKALSLISAKVSGEARDITVNKVSDFWRVRDHVAKQFEVWRAEYRSKNEGLRREVFIVDVALQSIQQRHDALRH